jgi:CRP/FNR family transcriptional regulator, anaerobic regulatory protein
MTELQQYLRAYMGVAEEDLQTLLSFFHLTTLEKGDYFVRSGRICDKLSFQLSGLMRSFAPYEDKEITQWISYKGTFITDLGGIVCDEPSRYTIQALTYCECYTIDKKDYRNLSQVIPGWPAMERLLIMHCFRFLETRIFALLAMTAEERYLHLLKQSPDLFHSVPLKYLASMMGMTPESLSRIRNKLTNYDRA